MCAGTGNGMAKSLMYAASEKCSVSNAVFAIIRGHYSISSLSHARKYMTHGNFLGRILRNTNFSLYTGHKQSLDVCTILQGEKKFFSVLLMTWGTLQTFTVKIYGIFSYCYLIDVLGLVAGIDIESEKYRWIGSARLDFYVCTKTLPFPGSSFIYHL